MIGLLFERLARMQALRAFRHRDFRLLWTGALFSFTGSWVQNVAQGWLVYDLTGDPAKLAFVSFCGMAPVAVVGPFAGAVADMLNRRVVLILCQMVFAMGALFLAWATWSGNVLYWHIVTVALINGFAGAIEMPTRQSLVSTVVPPEDIPAAIPINAMTFNLARVLGPAVGGVLLATYGAQTCYLINGLSYTGLISAVAAIRADLRAVPREPQPIKDLMFEGMLYTWRDLRLRTLFVMEVITSVFALFYMPLLPAIARDQLHLDKRGLGQAMSVVGLGAISGLLALLLLSDRPLKGLLARSAMLLMGFSICGLAFARHPWQAFPLLALAGASGVMQFNTTNTLFQLLSPDRLRGRVLAMHIWALSGFGPLTLPIFGWLARTAGLQTTLALGGVAVLFGYLYGWSNSKRLAGVG